MVGFKFDCRKLLLLSLFITISGESVALSTIILQTIHCHFGVIAFVGISIVFCFTFSKGMCVWGVVHLFFFEMKLNKRGESFISMIKFVTGEKLGQET